MFCSQFLTFLGILRAISILFTSEQPGVTVPWETVDNSSGQTVFFAQPFFCPRKSRMVINIFERYQLVFFITHPTWDCALKVIFSVLPRIECMQQKKSRGRKAINYHRCWNACFFFFCWWPFVQPEGIFTFPLAGIGKQWANNYNLLPCCRLDAISPRRSFCFCAGKKNRREESESELCVKVVDFSLKVLSCLLNFLGTFVTTAEHKKMGRDRIGWLRIPPDGDAQRVALSWVDSINFHLNKKSSCFFSWQSDQGKRDCKHVLTHANAL